MAQLTIIVPDGYEDRVLEYVKERVRIDVRNEESAKVRVQTEATVQSKLSQISVSKLVTK